MRILNYIIILFSVLALGACSSANNPERVVVDFLANIRGDDLEGAKTLLTEDSKDWLENFAKRSRYKNEIISTAHTISGDSLSIVYVDAGDGSEVYYLLSTDEGWKIDLAYEWKEPIKTMFDGINITTACPDPTIRAQHDYAYKLQYEYNMNDLKVVKHSSGSFSKYNTIAFRASELKKIILTRDQTTGPLEIQLNIKGTDGNDKVSKTELMADGEAKLEIDY